jgi:farnesyl diphosphate synthase
MVTLPLEISLTQLIEEAKRRTDIVFRSYLDTVPSLELKTAMRHSLLDTGKRIRPTLVYATGHVFHAPLENCDIPASVVELIHTYSLIHDDLPCMDNADLRRGKPSCHRAHGEGMAVLAGDALHTLAMQILAQHPATPLKPEKRNKMMAVLATACGPYGMAAGQALDMTLMHDPDLSPDLLLDIYALKTGALLTACIQLGHLASPDEDEYHHAALKQFGQKLGLAFQIQDDILDIEASTSDIGKKQGTDHLNHKMTYPTLAGLDNAKLKVQALYQEALETINYLGNKASLLRDITNQLLTRNR